MRLVLRPALVSLFAAATLFALVTSTASALQIQGYDAEVNERFVLGTFAGAPVANPDPAFTLAGYDLSGVGWRNNATQIAVTLISPEHFLTAAHVAPSAGSQVSFFGSDGIVRSYTVASAATLQFNAQNTDLTLGRLTGLVATDFITFYQGLFLGNTAAAYQNLPVTLYGSNGRVGLNTVDGVGNFSLLPFPPTPNDNVTDSVISLMDYDAAVGEAQGQGGDSGSPTLVRITGNQLALFGIHSAIATGPGGEQYTLDSLPLFSAFGQINAALIAAGYDGWGVHEDDASVVGATAIPEPAAAAVLLGAATLALIATRRRRAATGAPVA